MSPSGTIVCLALLHCLTTLSGGVSLVDNDPGFSALLSKDILVKRAGWTELTGWLTNVSSTGLYMSGTGLNPSNGRYSPPKSGIYMVSVSVLLDNASPSYMNLLLSVNNVLSTYNGMSSIEGRPSASKFTMTVNGAIEISTGDRISVYLYSSSDSSYTVLNESSFSARFIGEKESGPGFRARLSGTRYYRSTGWNELSGYYIARTAGLFTERDAFSTSTGRFTAPCSGAYFVAANVRLDSASGDYFRLLVAVNGNTTLRNGLHAMRGNPTYTYYTMNVAGVVSLSSGDYLSLWVFSSRDTYWYTRADTDFSVVFLSDLSQLSTGVHSSLGKDVSVTKAGSSNVPGWSTTGTKGLFTNDDFVASTGRFTAPRDGAYFISAQVRLDSVGGMAKAYVAVDGKKELTGVQQVWESPPSNYFTLTASGIVWLKTNQVVTPRISTKTDKNFVVQQESGLSVHYLYSHSSWSGVRTRLSKTVSSTSNTWTELKGWASKGNKKGLFVVGGSFNGATGRYTLALAGIYFVSANVHITGDTGSMTRLSVAVNGVATSSNGLTAVREKPTQKTYTLSVAGLLQLDNEQNVSLQVLSGSSSKWSVESTSDFTVSFVCGSLSVPAFAVNLAKLKSFASSGWQEVKGYSVAGSTGFFQSGGFSLDVSSGRFTAPISGVYLVFGNAEIYLGSGDFYRCAIVRNAITTSATTGLQSTVGEPKDSRFTCNVGGSVVLKAGEQLSFWIYSQSDTNWKLSSGTSLSVVYVGPSSIVRSVLAATSTDIVVTTSGWKEMSGYTTARDLQFSSSSTDFVPSTGRYTAPKQGLYYVSAQVNVLGATSSRFSMRIAVDSDTAGDGPYATKSSPSSKYLSLRASGIVKLQAGQYVSTHIDSKDDNNWKIAGNSGFSVTALSTVPETPGAIGFVSTSIYYRQSSWVEVKSLKLSTKTGLYQTGISDSFTTKGRFYAPTDGIYFVSANIRLDYATGSYFRGVIAVNGKTDTSNGLHSRRGYPPYYYYTINVAGIVSLSADDYVSVFVQSISDTSWYLRPESSFSARFMSHKRSAIGFLSDVVVDKNYLGSTATGWTELGNWRTNGSAGLYSSGAGFDAATGRYTVQQSGVYIVAANIELSNAGTGTFTVRAVVDRDVAKSNNGMVSVRQSTPNNYYTFSLTGAMYLTKGQTVSIYAHSQYDTNWKLSHESGFSLAYHSPYNYVPGFHAVLGSTKTVSTAYWKEITGWQSPSTGSGLFMFSTDFDPYTGRFTAPYAGEYFVSGNVRLDYAAQSTYRYYRLVVVVNGVQSYTTNIVQSASSRTPNSHSLAASGVLRLKKWDYVSLWIYNYYDTNWRISADTGFSVVFMGGDDQPARCLDNGPKFINHPQAVSKKVGDDVTLSCRAVGSPAPTYQWTLAGKSISGATEANYTLTNVTKSDTGDYRCVATVASVVSKTSNAARLTVYDPLPKFDKSGYAFSVTENGRRNRFIGSVRARADTSTGSNQYLTYTLESGDPKRNFTFSGYSTIAYLYVRGTLDREIQDAFNLTIKAVNRADTTLSATVTVTLTVVDENDNSPAFSQSSYVANVTENVPIGTTVTQIAATDPDATTNGKVTFSFLSGNTNGAFAIDSATGYIVTANAIDRERQIDYLLFVNAVDSPSTSTPNYDRTSVRITALDANDNAPTFVTASYSQTVSEGALVGTDVLQVAASDVDTGTNARIAYSITAGNNGSSFMINPTDGIITVAKPLDRETIPSYKLTVTATDGGSPALTGNTLVDVTISDVNDNSPTFSLSTYRASVRENLSSGSTVVKVLATEKDTGVTSIIGYSLDASVATEFAIDSKTGEVTTLKSFDREVKARYTFTVYAADSDASPRTGSATVVVSIADENDNVPTFSKSAYRVTVDETIQVGARVLQLSASDVDGGKNGNVTYTFASKSDDFVLDSLTGVIRTDSSLDYVTKSSYSLVAVATDGGVPAKTATVSVLVNVTDVNNNAPVFGQDEYNVTIPENVAVRTVLVTLTATDGDAGTNANIKYSIEGGNVGNKFYMSPNKGELTTAAPLDYETIDSYSLIIAATDGGSPRQTTLTQIEVDVSDVNDNSPVFSQTIYAASVSNLAVNRSVVATVNASDADSGAYGQVRYSLSGSTDFEVNPRTGEVYTTGSLLSQSQTIVVTLQITATDGGSPGRKGQSILTVKIVSNQASVLTFSVDTYTESVNENATIGSTVLLVQATSPDSTILSTLSYKINNPADAAPFRIDPKTGAITNNKSLDREAVPGGYTFIVQAKAGKQTAFANVRIRLIDVNDNSPSFSRASYSAQLLDTTPVATSALRLAARDPDAGTNGRITFSLIGGDRGDFTIDSALGTIHTAARLNASAASTYVLVAKAADGGNPPLSSTARVTIKIKATVNQPPHFATSVYTFVTREDVLSGSLIGTIQAYDRDVAPFNKVSYKFQSTSQPFVIDTNSGDIRTVSQLDYETTSSYTLTAIATDSGNPPKTAQALVSIIVTDVNDNTPVFSPSSYQVSVTDALPLGSSVVTVKATDKDSGTNGRLTFTITSGNLATKFHLDSTTGLLTLAGKLDRTATDSYVLTLQAQDRGNPSTSAQCIVTISVVQPSALKPVFTPSSYTTQVREDRSVGSAVVTVTAVEGSSSTSQATVIRYVLDGVGSNKFAIDPNTGAITVAQALDRETIASYSLVVTATDGRLPPNSATATVVVTVVDINDNSPAFSATSYQANVVESAGVGTSVLVVKATDKDSGINGRLTYSITNGNGNSAFTVDATTGVVSTRARLDRELIPKYVLRVSASDGGTPTRSTAVLVVVTVTDVNDQAPFFNQPVFNAEIREDSSAGTSVLTLTATDQDDGANAILTYSIESEDPSLPFAISPSSGLIAVRGKLRPETYSFTAVASDRGSPPMSGTCEVVVTVVDINNHSPVFFEGGTASYDAIISSSMELQTVVMTATATDVDQGDNGRVTYSIQPQSEAELPFSISRSTGAILLVGRVEDGQTYRFAVVASDGGVDSLSSSIEITITVNDEASSQQGQVGKQGGSGGDTAIIVGASVGAVAAILMIIVVALLIMKKRFSFKWMSHDDDVNLSSSVAFSSESPDNLAFSNPIYSGTGTNENALYQHPEETLTIETKTNPLYSSSDALDLAILQADLEVSLGENFSSTN